jgi:hypothetical protein
MEKVADGGTEACDVGMVYNNEISWTVAVVGV